LSDQCVCILGFPDHSLFRLAFEKQFECRANSSFIIDQQYPHGAPLVRWDLDGAPRISSLALSQDCHELNCDCLEFCIRVWWLVCSTGFRWRRSSKSLTNFEKLSDIDSKVLFSTERIVRSISACWRLWCRKYSRSTSVRSGLYI
jgi:hypothetical protein